MGLEALPRAALTFCCCCRRRSALIVEERASTKRCRAGVDIALSQGVIAKNQGWFESPPGRQHYHRLPVPELSEDILGLVAVLKPRMKRKQHFTVLYVERRRGVERSSRSAFNQASARSQA